MTRLRAVGRRLDSERGSLLIEVMIGAVLVAIASVAVLNGLDGAQDTGARNKARSVAAALAQQDQERMRSLPAQSLADYSDSRTVQVRGVSYAVESRATWVSDANGELSCTANAGPAQYFRISSSVTSPLTRGPVDEVSLVTPPPGAFAADEGTVAVQVIDRNASPIEGASVVLSRSGFSSLSETTNELGCAIFPRVKAGLWDIRVSSLSLVGWDGVSPAVSSVGVTAGAATLKQLELDSPAEIIARFDTRLPNGTTATVRSDHATVTNPKLASPGWKTFSAASPSDNFVRASSLFPFLDGYGVYAGACQENNPTLAPTNLPNYFTSFPLDPPNALAAPTPGGSKTVTVRMPSILIRVRNSSDVPQPNQTVFVTFNSCTTSGLPVPTFPTQLTDANGALPAPAFPFGSYRICAQNSSGTSHGHADLNTATSGHVNDVVNNVNRNGTGTPTGSPNTSIRITRNQAGSCH